MSVVMQSRSQREANSRSSRSSSSKKQKRKKSEKKVKEVEQAPRSQSLNALRSDTFHLRVVSYLGHERMVIDDHNASPLVALANVLSLNGHLKIDPMRARISKKSLIKALLRVARKMNPSPSTRDQHATVIEKQRRALMLVDTQQAMEQMDRCPYYVTVMFTDAHAFLYQEPAALSLSELESRLKDIELANTQPGSGNDPSAPPRDGDGRPTSDDSGDFRDGEEGEEPDDNDVDNSNNNKNNNNNNHNSSSKRLAPASRTHKSQQSSRSSAAPDHHIDPSVSGSNNNPGGRGEADDDSASSSKEQRLRLNNQCQMVFQVMRADLVHAWLPNKELRPRVYERMRDLDSHTARKSSSRSVRRFMHKFKRSQLTRYGLEHVVLDMHERQASVLYRHGTFVAVVKFAGGLFALTPVDHDYMGWQQIDVPPEDDAKDVDDDNRPSGGSGSGSGSGSGGSSSDEEKQPQQQDEPGRPEPKVFLFLGHPEDDPQEAEDARKRRSDKRKRREQEDEQRSLEAAVQRLHLEDEARLAAERERRMQAHQGQVSADVRVAIDIQREEEEKLEKLRKHQFMKRVDEKINNNEPIGDDEIGYWGMDQPESTTSEETRNAGKALMIISLVALVSALLIVVITKGK